MTRSNSLARGLFTAALLAGVIAALVAPALYAAGAAPFVQPEAVSGVVISEFRARGPTGGQDEIIELYNSSQDPVDIGGWSLWQSNALGGTNSLKDADGKAAFPAGTILHPGQHFLAANDNAYSGSVQPDWAYVTGQIQNNGGIALINAGNGIEDQMGMSVSSAYLEGSPLPAWDPGRNTDESHERKDGGNADNCVDTNNNAADFLTFVTSNPQNTSSSLSLCGAAIASTTTRITSIDPPGAVVGQAVTVIVRVTGPGTPTGGIVSIKIGTVDFCNGPLLNGQATCSAAFATAGNKTLTAVYGGHGTWGASTSAPAPYQVAKGDSTTTILTDTPDPSGLSQAVTVTFKVDPAAGGGTPTGDVKVIVDGTSNSCTGRLSAAQGQCALSFFSPGAKTLHAEYQGDANFNASTSAGAPHVVLPGPTNTSRPPTATNTLPPGYSVIINEIAWSGTNAAEGDEWIELYNVTGTDINLSGWRIYILGKATIQLNRVIPAHGYFLLEHGSDSTVSDIPADLVYIGTQYLLSDTVERLYLYNASGSIVDTVNTYSSKWLAGSVTGNRSMERRGVVPDSLTAWVTNTGVIRNGKDAEGNPINGTPKRQNWATTVTLTPSPRPTIYPSRTLPPQPRPVINEFLPRAAYDWNQDGRVDVFDEFIEVANLGPVDVNLQGWKLDDVANAGSDPFSLPNMVLKPGERALFYGKQTNILLSDGGDTVRLLSPANVIFDAQSYPVVTVADQTWCRLPDLRGSWYSDCFPTPNLPNQRRGQLPSLPPGTGLEEPLCLLADTLPEEFLLAECRGFGEDMFNMRYWDRTAWWSEFRVLQNGSKWESFVQ